MSNFAKSFKDEITRLARKEAKATVAPTRKPAAATRSTVADLKQRVNTLDTWINREWKLSGKGNESIHADGFHVTIVPKGTQWFYSIRDESVDYSEPAYSKPTFTSSVAAKTAAFHVITERLCRRGKW